MRPDRIIPIGRQVDALEIASLLHVRPNTVRVWSIRHKGAFPEEVRTYGNRRRTRVWDLDEVLDWAADTDRLPEEA